MSTANDNTAKWAVRKFGGAGLPVGFEYLSMNPNIPAGSLPLLGGVYSRTVYKDLWAWVQEQAGYLIEESVWQEKSAANEGNVPFYSTGDGSTTFRVPSLKCWVKGANGIEEVGSYLSAGLPNITGTLTSRATDYNGSEMFWGDGVFSHSRGTDAFDALVQADKDFAIYKTRFDASYSSSIYGNSDTVQPKSIVGMWLVKAYGTVTNVGSTDVAAIASGLTRVENKLNEAAIVGTVTPYAGSSIPTGYLPCNGAAVSRETYASLFGAIGETYGSGDGSTTFNLPNLTDKFIQGSDTAGTVKSAGLPEIVAWWCGAYEYTSGISSDTSWGSGAVRTYKDSNNSIEIPNNAGAGKMNYQFDASRYNSIYGNSNTVQPPALTMRYIIKY